MHPTRTKHVHLLVAAICIFTGSIVFSGEKYRVARGDNLYRIGKKFGVSYHDIMSANKLKSTVIYPDQVLIIPSKQQPQAPVAVAQRAPSPPTPPPAAPRQASKEDPLGIGYRPGNHSAGTSDPLRPVDPVEPYASAKRIPDATQEDPLGIGYNPSPSPYNSPPQQSQPNAMAKTAPSVPAHSYPGQKHRPHQVPVQSFPPSREVPAVAHTPKINSNTFKIETEFKFPTPSFKNPCKPTHIGSRSRSSTYLVKSGDSVWGISRKHGISPFKLRKANNLMFSRIRPGMKLVIPN